MGRSLGYMVVPFLGGWDTLGGGPVGHKKMKVPVFDTFVTP